MTITDVVPLPPSEAILVRASASFHTNDDDKDFDTTLVISVEKGVDQFAKSELIVGDTFEDHRNQGPFSLRIQGTNSKLDLRGGTSTITIQPNGNDTWRFNYFLELTFNDGSVQAFSFFGNELKEDRNIKTFPL